MKKTHIILIVLLIILIAGIVFINDKGPNPFDLREGQYFVRIDPDNCDMGQGNITLRLKPNSFCKADIMDGDKKIRTVTANINSKGFRKTPEKFDPTKKRIVIMGSTFPFGLGLNDNETFPWVLSEITNRKVYNISIPMGGIQQALIYLMSKSFYKTIENVDTFIYVLIDDDLFKMYGPPFPNAYDEYYPIFKVVNHQLFLVPPPAAYKMGKFISSKAHTMAYKRKVSADIGSSKSQELFKLMMNECKNQIRLNNPNAKFIVLNFQNDPNVSRILKENKINVINGDEIFKEENLEEKYINLEYRPNAEFWKKFTPLFAKKLNL